MNCQNIHAHGIQRGTTPTITIAYRVVDVHQISVAWLTIHQCGYPFRIERDLSSAAVDQNTLSWTLTQEETLRLSARVAARIQCRYLLADGTAGSSPSYSVPVDDILHEGVIA